MWVTVAITVFGGLFGVVGLIIGVPAFSVIYSLIKEATEKKLAMRGLQVETDAYYNDPSDAVLYHPRKKRIVAPCFLHVANKTIHLQRSIIQPMLPNVHQNRQAAKWIMKNLEMSKSSLTKRRTHKQILKNKKYPFIWLKALS